MPQLPSRSMGDLGGRVGREPIDVSPEIGDRSGRGRQLHCIEGREVCWPIAEIGDERR